MRSKGTLQNLMEYKQNDNLTYARYKGTKKQA